MNYVYHIRKDTNNPNLNIGYIGVTSRTLEERWLEHKTANSKVGNKIRDLDLTIDNMVKIFSGTNQECYSIEKALRPKQRMGWNIAEGGRTNSFAANKTIQTAPIKPTRELNTTSVDLTGWTCINQPDGLHSHVKDNWSIRKSYVPNPNKNKKAPLSARFSLYEDDTLILYEVKRAWMCVQRYNELSGILMRS